MSRSAIAEGRTISGASARLDALFGQPPGGVFGGQQLAQVPRRIAQRRGHRVPAIDDGRAVGLAAQAVAAGAFEAFAPLDLLAGGAGFGAGWAGERDAMAVP